jgi:hypothetical protein
LIAAEGPAIKKNSRFAKKRVLAAGLQEMFHGRRPLAAMKHFLAEGVSCFKKSSSQRFLKKKSLFSAPSANSSEAGET